MVTTMGNAGVSQASEFLIMRSSSPNITESSGTGQSFSGILENVGSRKTESSKAVESSTVQPKESYSSKTEKAEETIGNSSDEALNENSEELKSPEETGGKEKVNEDEALEEYVSAVSKVVVQISQILEVSPEQLVDAMEEAGINSEELLTGEGLTKVMTILNNLEDSVGIILDEQLHGQFKEAMSVITEALDTDEILSSPVQDVGDFSEIMDKLNEQLEIITDENSEISIHDGEVKNADVKPDDNQSQVFDEEKNTGEERTISEEVQVTNEEDRSTGGNDNTAGKGKNDNLNSFTDEKGSDNAAFTGQVNNSSFNSVMNGISEAVGARFDSVTADNIIRQITEQIRATAGNNSSSIELTLNPESLGKVNIQVVSKDGAVTAQISAETEIAKNAIESQISTLKETLSNQNIKVDAVEVTIASHSFDQNEDASSHGNEERQKKGIAKKISLEELFNENPEEQEEDIIMKAEGSTISFSA